MLLEEKVIGGGNVVMLISLDTPLCVFNVEIELFQIRKDLFVDRNSVVSHDYATIQRNVVHLLAPIMCEYLLDLITFTWIYI